MITEKEYQKAKLIVQLYECINSDIDTAISPAAPLSPPPPAPPPDRILIEGQHPQKPR
jgi:hypothetical protein